MKTSLIITALMIALAAVNTCKSAEQPKVNFILVIEDELIKVCDEKGDDLGIIEIEKWRALSAEQRANGNWYPVFAWPFTQDTLRHFALDAVAALVSDGREHTVDPHVYVTTYDESNTRGNAQHPITITIERGTGFAMLRDSLKPCGETCKGIRYRAEITMIDSKAMEQALAPRIKI
jgi:hypothetical protein